jgi:NAD(P)-dependent dehydrogenase (short-subunit alcohol dehydrogenase family)
MGLTRQLAFELADKNIAVNSVVPGNVGTEEGEKDWLELPADLREFVMKSTPIKRLARPEELAAAIAFLASDDASYITGVSLDVNGGLWTS